MASGSTVRWKGVTRGSVLLGCFALQFAACSLNPQPIPPQDLAAAPPSMPGTNDASTAAFADGGATNSAADAGDEDKADAAGNLADASPSIDGSPSSDAGDGGNPDAETDAADSGDAEGKVD